MDADTSMTEPLPPLYEGWVRGLVGRGVPRETRATCSDCAMCAKPGTVADPLDIWFEPGTKCCTYVPELPNFLVGGVLSDDDPQAAPGRDALLKRIGRKVAVTPLGVGRHAAEAHLYDGMDGAFGRTGALRCPYYLEDRGACGLWRHRNAVCSTWFCKHERGEVGFRFWTNRLKPLLLEIEAALRVWCVREAGLGPDAMAALVDTETWSASDQRLTADALNERVDERAYTRLWGDWAGRETDFFKACADRVRALAWDEVLSVSGPRAQVMAELTRDAFAKLETRALPAKVAVGRFQVVKAGAETTRVSTYSTLDPLEAPNLVLALLGQFQDRAPLDVAAALEAQTGVRLESGLIQKLVDFGLLVEAPE